MSITSTADYHNDQHETIRLLHVDDDPDLADLTATFLTREDDRFDIEIAHNVSEGLDRLTENEFDCIISDYDMPGKNGIEFLENVRENYPDLPFILFTGKGSEEVASDAISAGATDYLQKGGGNDKYQLLANRARNAVDQYRATREAQTVQRRLQELAESTTDCLWMFNRDWNELLFISGYEDVWGRSAENVKENPQDFLDGVDPEDQEFVKKAMSRLSTGESIDIEYKIRRGDDEPGWVWVKGEPIFDDDGNVVRVVGFTREITERKEHEQELEMMSLRLEAILDNTTTPMFMKDDEGRYIFVNQGYRELFELNDTEIVGRTDHELHPPEMAEKVQANDRLVLERDETVETEEQIMVDGIELTFLSTKVPIYDTENSSDPEQPVAVFGVASDITELKDRERELEETNAILSTLFETLPVGILAEDTSRNVLAVNEQLVELFDIPGSPEEVIGTDCERLVDQVSDNIVNSEGFAERINELVVNCKPADNEEVSLNDGRTFERSYRPIQLPNADGHLWMYRDVTERKEREARLSGLNETMRHLIATDTNEQISEIGVEAARDVLGLEANAIHLYDDEQAALVPVAKTDTVRDLVGDLPTFTDGNSIGWRAYEQGETVVVNDVHNDPDVYNPETPIKSELHLPLGEHGILVAGSGTQGAFDQQDLDFGEILAGGITTALEQVERTEQIRTREQELTRQNERLEEFTSIVSHDLRNPLNVAEGRLELAQGECDSEHLDDISRALERMNTLIDDLLTLARDGDQVGELEAVHLGDLTENCWQNVATAEARLITEIDRAIHADRSRLQQLLENLLRNAVEHGGESVKIIVGELEDGFYVEDNGSGIPKDERDDIFRAGYSTSEDGPGFGLRIVKQVARAHGWDVRVTDGGEGGARFEITGIEFTSA